MSTPKINIPPRDIYKIYQLDSNGNASHIWVFQGNNEPVTNLHDLFSDTELTEIELYSTNIHYSSQQIHRDDSIRIIKKKIINGKISKF